MISKVFIFFLLLILVKIGGSPLNQVSNRLTVATWDSYFTQNEQGLGTYAFGYDIEDSGTGNVQFRQEERHNSGTVTGRYGYIDPDGNPVLVIYIADDRGYRVKIEKSGRPDEYFPNEDAFYGSSFESPSKNFL